MKAHSQDLPLKKATFAAGCFWGVQAAFDRIDGVIETEVGYIGGRTDNPTYEQVCHERTGHAEAVHITFDPSKVSFGELLTVFWENHDPTQLNRQGPDHGDQYRSAIFTHSEEQRFEAEAAKKILGESGRFSDPIVTVIEPAGAFYKAEDYHQHYLAKRSLGSCHI